MSIRETLFSALTHSRSAEISLRSSSTSASSNSSECSSVSSSAYSAAWDNGETDVSSIGSSASSSLYSVSGRNGDIHEGLTQADSERSYCRQDIENARREIEQSNLEPASKARLLDSLSDASRQDGNVSYAMSGVSGDLSGAESAVSAAASAANEVSADGPDKDVSGAGSTLRDKSSDASREYSSVASQSGSAADSQRSVSQNLQEAYDLAGRAATVLPVADSAAVAQPVATFVDSVAVTEAPVFGTPSITAPVALRMVEPSPAPASTEFQMPSWILQGLNLEQPSKSSPGNAPSGAAPSNAAVPAFFYQLAKNIQSPNSTV